MTDADPWVVRSAQASLAVQVVTGIVTAVGIALPQASGIQTILAIESASQVVEFVYYAVAVARYGGAIQTWTRYVDWFLSTPVMILSTCMFFEHRRGGEVLDVLTARADFYLAATLNALMLAFGLGAELAVLPRDVGLVCGGYAFVGTWTMVARTVDDGDPLSMALFYTIYAVWFLYGVAAALPYRWKNVGYNLLDLVSKNFYGIFLFVYVLVDQRSEEDQST